MKIILGILAFAFLFFTALVFSTLNLDPVEVNLYFTSLSIPLALALTVELLAGIFLGYIISFWKIVSLRSQNSKLKKELVQQQKRNNR